MFLLDDYPEIIDHLTNVTGLQSRKTNKEYIFFCPFCDDIDKKTHGHLYLALDKPVFYCFKCNISGSIFKLLKLTGYNKKIAGLEVYYEPKTANQYIYQTEADIFEKIQLETYEFSKNNPMIYKKFEDYIKYRIGPVNPTKFLIVPEIFQKKLYAKFYNYDGIPITMRCIDENELRYHQINIHPGYFFQEKNLINNSSIVFAEGCFDIINLYLYSNLFNNSFFYAILRNHYVKAIEDVIINNLLMGNYTLNIVFDADVKNINKIIYFSKNLLTLYNNTNIKFNFFRPIISKDAAECAELIKL